MGLSHWGESDNAADFRYVLVETFKKNPVEKGIGRQERAIRELVREEMKNQANCYNTEGAINVALVMESEGVESKDWEDKDDTTPVFSKMLTETEFRMVIDRLTTLLKEADEYLSKTRWDGTENVDFHKTAYKRLKELVLRKSYKE